MAKPNIWRDKIIKVLKNMSLNYEKLYESVKSEVNKECEKKKVQLSKRPERLFIEQLVKLIDNGNLIILGFDKSVYGDIKKIQSFKIEGLVFELAKTDSVKPMYIISLLEQSKNNTKQGEIAQIKLSKIFETKFKEYETKEIDFYEHIKEKVRSKLLVEYVKEIEKTLIELKSENDESLEVQIDFFSYKLGEYTMELNNHPQAMIWTIENLTKDDAIKFPIYRNIRRNVIIKNPSSHNHKWISEPWIAENGNFTSEEFLAQKGLVKLEKKKYKEIRELFDYILFLIFSTDDNTVMNQGFSLALSDKDSMKFKTFLKKVDTFERQLSKELGLDDEI